MMRPLGHIGESGHGVSSESMFAWEVPGKLPFQECGTTFLADLDVQIAWVLLFCPRTDAFHVSPGPEFCTLQPLLVNQD